MAQSVTVSCGTGTLVLNPTARTTTVGLSYSFSTGSSNSTVMVEYSLDDPTITPTPTLQWLLLSSAAAIASSNLGAGGLSWTVLSPIGAVRVNSTANSSLHSYTLKALQAVTA